MSRIATALGEEYRDTNTSVGVDVLPLIDEVVGKVRPALLVFLGAVGLVLLIACANVANLMLARAAAREREVAIRATLGAGRRHLLRPLLAESLLVALVGGATGLFLAFWSLELLRAAQPSFLPRLEDIALDGRVLGVTLALTLLTGVLFTIVPAARLVRGQLNETLREGTRGASGGAAAQRMRSALVLAEVATALVLLTGAGLLLRSFDQLQRVDAGFDGERVLSLQVILPSARYGGAANIERRRSFAEQLVEQARAVPGVQLAAVSSTLPTAGTPYSSFFIAGRPLPDAGTNQDVQNFAASPDYFRLMGIRLVRGRLFTAQDDGAAPGVVVINEEMARRYWPNADPLGARVSYGDPTDSTTRLFTVIGVVADVKQEGLGAASYAQWYEPVAQRPVSGLYLSVKTAADPLAAAGALRRVVSTLDSNLPVADIQTMEQRVGASLAQPRVSAALLGGFSGIALLLAAVGIYGVMAYAVAQRTREIGIRMALGARPDDVRRLVVRQGMVPVALGVALGLAGALAATRLMRSLLFGVSTADPFTFVAMATFLVAVALFASYLPARRATRVDPLIAMRSE
jgi:putative ABC transport system permease protein